MLLHDCTPYIPICFSAYFDGMDYVVGSPIRRSRSDVRRPVDQDGVHVDDKLVSTTEKYNCNDILPVLKVLLHPDMDRIAGR